MYAFGISMLLKCNLPAAYITEYHIEHICELFEVPFSRLYRWGTAKQVAKALDADKSFVLGLAENNIIDVCIFGYETDAESTLVHPSKFIRWHKANLEHLFSVELDKLPGPGES